MPTSEPFTLIRTRRRTLSLQIGRGGEVIVRAPLRAPREWVFEFVERQKAWIDRQRARRAGTPAEPIAFDHGALLPFGGGRFPLVHDPDARECGFDGEYFLVPPVTSAQVRILWTAWCKKRALEACAARASGLAVGFGLHLGRVSVREAKTRWGSCAPSGDLMFNWKLILAPPSALDYVVAHELAHLAVKNHSRRFWKTVAAILPSYETGRRWLRERGAGLLGS